MSQENVDIVRRVYEHFNRTGEPDYSILDPAIVYDVSRRTFDPMVYHGHDGIREFLALIREQWATMRLEPEDFVDVGENVVVSIRLVGVGRESGVETTASAAHVWTVRGGRIIKQTTFQTMEEALEAVGLRGRRRG